MRRVKLIFTVLLALSMLLSTAGCTVNETGTAKDDTAAVSATAEASMSTAAVAEESTASQSDTAVTNEKYKEELEKAKGKELKLLMWYEMDQASRDFYTAFEEKYGMKVKHIVVYGPMLPAKLATMIAAGDAPDVVPAQDFAVPSIMVKKLVQPVENYLDVENPVFKINDMDQFKMDGHYYAATSGVGPYLLFYNKSMFENNGVKTPTEYYEEGDWTFENFRQAAMELTQDTNSDGKVEQWGYCTNLEGFEFVSRNGGDFAKYDSASEIKLTIEDPKTVEGLQFFQDGYIKDKYIMPGGENSYTTDFEAGKIAMTVSPDWIITALLKPQMKDEWDFTSLPVGPKGDTSVQPSSWFAWAIATGSKNPYGAGAWITFNYETGAASDKNKGPNYYHGNELTEAQLALYKLLEEKVVFNKASGIGKWTDVYGEFSTEVKEGKSSLSSLIAKYKPQFQTEIDNTIKDTGAK